VGSGKVSRAAILGLAGGVWAATPGYSVRAINLLFNPSCSFIPLLQLSLEEQKAIVGSFKDLDQTQINGVRLAGNKFHFLRVEGQGRSIYLRKGV
jgi:profilin